MLSKSATDLLALLKAHCLREDDPILGSSLYIKLVVASGWRIDKVERACRELHEAGLLECYFEDGKVDRARLVEKESKG